jgi:hypothetical protein
VPELQSREDEKANVMISSFVHPDPIRQFDAAFRSLKLPARTHPHIGFGCSSSSLPPCCRPEEAVPSPTDLLSGRTLVDGRTQPTQVWEKTFPKEVLAEEGSRWTTTEEEVERGRNRTA